MPPHATARVLGSVAAAPLVPGVNNLERGGQGAVSQAAPGIHDRVLPASTVMSAGPITGLVVPAAATEAEMVPALSFTLDSSGLLIPSMTAVPPARTSTAGAAAMWARRGEPGAWRGHRRGGASRRHRPERRKPVRPRVTVHQRRRLCGRQVMNFVRLGSTPHEARVPGGPLSTVGTYSSSCSRPSNVRLATISSAMSG
jgi:hypothetical protein